MKRKALAIACLGILLVVTACTSMAGLGTTGGQTESTGVQTPNDVRKGYRELTVEQVKSRLAANPKVRLVDVRSEAEYRDSHIEGAIVIPLEGVRDKAASELGKDEEIIFYCHTGPMGAQAARILTVMGYSNVSNMQGGIAKWKAAGYPLVR